MGHLLTHRVQVAVNIRAAGQDLDLQLDKIVITVQSTPTDEQTLAKIQQMIDASVERLKDSMKFQIQQEKQVEQAAPAVLNQQDLDDMLDNLTIFDQ